jgi:hypothetical protein
VSKFHDKFIQNSEFPDWYEWKVSPPILPDARIQYLLNPLGFGFDEDGASAELISVIAYCENGNGFGTHHENAWNFITDNAAKIERELRRKLWPACLQNYKAFLADVEPDDEDWQDIKDAVNWEQEDALDFQIKLTEIGLVDDGFDEVGFSIFEFAVGWDEEHGRSILMHKDRVLAASGGADFTNRGSNLIPHAKYIQAHEFLDGDFRIER